MIRIYELDRRIAEIELLEGKLKVVSYVGDEANKLVEAMRLHVSPEDGPLVSDAEVYEALPVVLGGLVWAARD